MRRPRKLRESASKKTFENGFGGFGGGAQSCEVIRDEGVGGIGAGYLEVGDSVPSIFATRTEAPEFTDKLTAAGAAGFTLWLEDVGAIEGFEMRVGVGTAFSNFWQSTVRPSRPPVCCGRLLACARALYTFRRCGSGAARAAPRRRKFPAQKADIRMSTNGTFGEFELLRKLTETPGVPGREERIRELILEETRDLWDETRVDAMGNLICLKRAVRKPARASRRGVREAGSAESDRPLRVMLSCHMDEIGFYVRYIDADGRLRLINAGGFDTRNLFARKVLVQGRRDLVGVLNPGGKPVHVASEEERKKVPEIREFFVDLFLPRAQVVKLVEVGDPVTLIQNTQMVGEALVGKAMDNRVSLWVGIHAVRKAARRLRYDTYFVASVQEEVGLRGATTAAYGVDPDIGVAIDVTLACDTPGIDKDDAVTELGKGVAIKVMDSSSISHRGLFEEFVALARKHKIPHQLEVLPRGGTDAGAVQRTRAGTRAITLSIPTRYIHTITEAIHRRDAKAAVDLLAAWLSA